MTNKTEPPKTEEFSAKELDHQFFNGYGVFFKPPYEGFSVEEHNKKIREYLWPLNYGK